MAFELSLDPQADFQEAEKQWGKLVIWKIKESET